MGEFSIKNFKYWINDNKLVLITIFLIYQVVILSIGIINYPYIDDISRRRNGSPGFAKTYSRWGSEIASWMVQGSRHLTDMGLTSHILTGLILSVASVIALYVLSKKMTILPAIASTIIGLNPWFLQCISFRFDSPFMALSVLFSLIPFLWWEKNRYLFFATSIVSLFLMCNTYQSSSGIYIVMVLSLTLKDLLAGEHLKKASIPVFLGAFSYIIAMLMYAVQTTFNPHLAERGDIVKIAPFKEIPATFIANTKMYLNAIYSQSARLWILLFFILIIFFILSSVLKSKISILATSIYTIIYLVTGAIFSYGVYLIFIEDLAEFSPRHAYGFSVFVAITIILLLSNLTQSLIKIPMQIVTSLFCYYILTFPFVYASALQYQLSSFETQSVMLANELKDVVDKTPQDIYTNRLFKNSSVFDNTSKNYPLMRRLVPDNSSLYWPNQELFTTITEMHINFIPFDPAKSVLSEQDLQKNNYYYKVYKNGENIYLIMK